MQDIQVVLCTGSVSQIYLDSNGSYFRVSTTTTLRKDSYKTASSTLAHIQVRIILSIISTGRSSLLSIFSDVNMGTGISVLLGNLLLGCLTLALVYVSHQCVTTSITRRKIIQKYGCEQPYVLPRKDPFLGLDLIREAIHAAKTKTSIARQLAQHAQYGHTFSSRFLMTPVIHTTEPENIMTMLTTKFDDYGVGSRRKGAFAPLLGKSIFQVDGLQWKHSRGLLRGCFSKAQTENLPKFEVHVNNLISAIPRDGSTVDLGELFPRLTADVTTDYMFGKSIMSLKNPSSLRNDFLEAMHDSQTGCEERWLMGSFAKVVPQRAFYKSVKRVHDFMDRHINEAQLLYKLSTPNSRQDDGYRECYAFLHELEKVSDDKQFLRDALLTFFFAGVDAAAALLTNLFFILAKRPDIWQGLRHEAEALHGEKPDMGQLRSLGYHQSCLKECKPGSILQ